jgi:hypothetical protein
MAKKRELAAKNMLNGSLKLLAAGYIYLTASKTGIARMMDTMDYKELYSLTLSLYSLTTAMLEFKVSSDHTVQFPTGQKK